MPSLCEALRTKLGPEVREDPETLDRYAEDLTEAPPHRPDVVVAAHSVEDVQTVLAIAREYHASLVPVVSNMNVGGLAIPEKGGIVLDLAPMNRILEVNEQDMYLVIEPGVTWKQIKETLDFQYSSLRFGYSLSPPESSVLCNCLMDGLTNLSLRFGPTSEWINGLEAVLSDGTIVRTGIGAAGGPWCTNSPMPDLTGLFVNVHGTTGIVTKLSVQAWPNRKYRRRYFLPTIDMEAAVTFMQQLAREEFCDDIGGISWPVAKMLFGVNHPKRVDPGEPWIYILVDFSSNFDDDLEIRDRHIRNLAGDCGLSDILNVSDLVKLLPEFSTFVDLPARLGFLLDHGGGGLTWIGTYGPTSGWLEGIRSGARVMEQHGFPPSIVLRPMRVGHFGVLRLLTTFDKKNVDEVARVRALNEAIVDTLVPLGFFPYKTPPWVVRALWERIDPGFRAVLERVRHTLDPYGLLNPGKWSPR